jgi:hypothetical protein
MINKNNFLRNIYFFIFISSLFFTAISGAARYYFDIAGLGVLIYLPKILMAAWIPLAFFTSKINKKLLILSVLIIWFVFYSFLNVSLVQMIFGIYLLSPLLFGMLYVNNFDDLRRISKFFIFIFWISVIGVFLDFFYQVPWKGYRQMIDGHMIEASRQWSTMGIDRLAGFTRMSTTAAIFIGISSLFYISLIKNNFAKIFIFLLAVVTIVLTTNKSVAGAYMLSMILFVRWIRIYFGSLSVFLALAAGIGFPLYAIFVGFSLDVNNIAEKFIFASFNDRLENTWPDTVGALSHFANMHDNLVYLFGLGIGGFGTSSKYFSHNVNFGVADNSWLYAYGLLGIFGVAFLLYISYVGMKALKSKDVMLISYGIVFNFILWVGVTTDVFEDMTSLFIMGYLVFIMKKIRIKTC